MNYEHKTNLQKALISQTWNEVLASKIVTAIEENLRKPKPSKGPSMLQIAVEKEKGKTHKLQTYNHEDAEE